MTEPNVEFRHGIASAWNAGAFTCDVKLTGSLHQWAKAVPVARNILAGDMVNGRQVIVAFPDPMNHGDAVVVCVYV
jgi:hypothetical protein